MNYGGDAADQIVRYSMEGVEHTLRISGSIAKNLAVLIVAVMKDCLLYTSPSPRDMRRSRMPSSA